MASLLSTTVNGTLNSTGRITASYNTDRYQMNFYRSSGSNWWITNDSDRLGIHLNNVGDKFYFANDGDFWTAQSGWLSTALAGKLSTSGNAASATTASQVSGVAISSAQAQALKNTLNSPTLPYSCDIYVEGEANKFYPVHFMFGDQDIWRRIIIRRGYGEEAPWDPIGTGVHHGGLLIDWEGNFGGWGGAEYADRLRVYNESYTNVCADMYLYTHAMGYVFMLRGGHALYHIFSDQPIRGYYQEGTPDIAYNSSTLFYDDNWSGNNTYDVYAPRPLELNEVNSSRIDGLRTKKQSLFDSRYQLASSAINTSNIGSQSVNYASSAGSVAWSNVSSRPTALSQFTNDLGNYGGWYSASGGHINGYVRINKNWGEGDFGAEQLTIYGTYPSIALRSTTHDSKWLIHNDSSVSFYYGAGASNNSWSRRFEIPQDGNIWMSWAGDHISNLLGAKQNASTAITTSNIGSQSVNYASSAGNADTVDSLHASDFVRAYTTTSDNIDANWGQSFKTFDPVPSGTPPIDSPNLRTINVGEDYNRRTQMAFTYSEDRAWFRRRTEAGWGSWREFIHSGNISTQSVSYASSSGNADTVDNYHASSLWRSDGGNWNPGANITLYQTGNGQEWSFDIYRQGYTGGYWHVWDSAHSTMLAVDATSNYVWASGSFRAPIFYDLADTSYYVDPNDYSRLWRTSTHIAPSPGVGSSNWVNDFNNTPVSSMSFGGDLSSGGPSGTWWFQQNMRHGNSSSSWGTQIAWGWEDNANELRQRNVSGGNWSNWTRYINTNNFQTLLNPYYFSIPAWTTGTQTNVRSSYVTSGRWYRVANLGTERFFARVRIYDDSSSGPHSSVEFQVAGAFNNIAGYSFTMTSNGYYSSPSVTEVRILSAGTYDPQYLEVYINYVGYQYSSFAITLLEARNATLVNFDEGGVPSGYSRTSWLCNAPLATGGRRAIFNDGLVAYNNIELATNSSIIPGFDLNSTGTAKVRYLAPGVGTMNINAPFAHNSSYGAINIAMTDNDTGGVVIDNEGVTVYGAGDTGTVFRVIDEDVWQTNGNNVDAATTFRVYQDVNGGTFTRGSAVATADMRAPIFYDSDNTGYYVNPNSSSQFNSVYANDWFRPQGNTGVYFQSYGRGIWSADSAGSSYGNVSIYGDGINSWPGWAINNLAIFMARDTRRGIFIPSADSWLIRYEESANEAFVDFNLTWGSDIRYKSNVNTISSALDKVTALRGVTYNYKGSEKTSIGFIAQEVEQVVPEVVSTDIEGFKGVGYANMVALLTEAIKEQQTIINDLKARIELLESK